MKKITVFTTTYNRAYCLHKLYDSLCRQTNDGFIWLVVDDGSVDNTKELVAQWIGQNKIQIQYIYQQNQGMHAGHNTAYENISTELNVCIDSDDYMTDHAIQIILDYYNIWKDDESVAGFIALDAYEDGAIVGTPFPDGLERCKYSQLKARYGVVGDKKFVYKTEVIKKYPKYPVFKEERFVPLNYLYAIIDQKFDLVVIPKVLCVVEYMPDGSSKNIIISYRKNPRGFAHERLQNMIYAYTRIERFKNAVHYISSSIFIKNIHFFKDSTNKWATFFAIPFGVLLNIYVRFTRKKGFMKS